MSILNIGVFLGVLKTLQVADQSPPSGHHNVTTTSYSSTSPKRDTFLSRLWTWVLNGTVHRRQYLERLKGETEEQHARRLLACTIIILFKRLGDLSGSRVSPLMATLVKEHASTPPHSHKSHEIAQLVKYLMVLEDKWVASVEIKRGNELHCIYFADG